MRHGWRPFRRLHYFSWSSIVLGLGVGCATDSSTEIRMADRREAWSCGSLSGRRITTKHFEIVSTLSDGEFEDALPGLLELIYERYERVLPAPDGASSPLTVYLLANRQEWEWFTRRRFPARHELYSRIRQGGYTEGDVSVSFHTSRSGTLATLAHEVWHQYVGSRLDEAIPAWLEEGLACYHEALYVTGERPVFTPRENSFRINSLCEAVQRDTLLSLQEIVDIDMGQVIGRDDSRTTEAYYAQAWALITFLRHGAGGRYGGAFDRLLADLAAGTFGVHVGAARLGSSDPSGMSLGRAVFEAYFGSPAVLADEYYDHLVRLCAF